MTFFLVVPNIVSKLLNLGLRRGSIPVRSPSAVFDVTSSWMRRATMIFFVDPSNRDTADVTNEATDKKPASPSPVKSTTEATIGTISPKMREYNDLLRCFFFFWGGFSSLSRSPINKKEKIPVNSHFLNSFRHWTKHV